MAVTYVGSESNQDFDVATEVAVPSGVQSGDLLILFACTNWHDGHTLDQSGWTELDTSQQSLIQHFAGVWARFATGSEPSGYGITWDATGQQRSLTLHAFRGVGSIGDVQFTTDTVTGTLAFASVSVQADGMVFLGGSTTTTGTRSIGSPSPDAITHNHARLGITAYDAFASAGSSPTYELQHSVSDSSTALAAVVVALNPVSETPTQTAGAQLDLTVTLGVGVTDAAAPPETLVSFVGSSSFMEHTTETSVAAPTGTQSGDLLIMVGCSNWYDGHTLDEGGWTEAVTSYQANIQHFMGVWWRFVGTGDPSSYGITWGTLDQWRSITLHTFRDVSTVGPVDVAVAAATDAVAFPALSVPGGAVVFLAGSTTTTGTRSIVDPAPDAITHNGTHLVISGYAQFPFAGLSPAYTLQHSTGSGDTSLAAATLVVNPLAEAPPTPAAGVGLDLHLTLAEGTAGHPSAATGAAGEPLTLEVSLGEGVVSGQGVTLASAEPLLLNVRLGLGSSNVEGTFPDPTDMVPLAPVILHGGAVAVFTPKTARAGVTARRAEAGLAHGRPGEPAL